MLDSKLVDFSAETAKIAFKWRQAGFEPGIFCLAGELLLEIGECRLIVSSDLLLLPPVVTRGTREQQDQQEIEKAEPGAARFRRCLLLWLWFGLGFGLGFGLWFGLGFGFGLRRDFRFFGYFTPGIRRDVRLCRCLALGFSCRRNFAIARIFGFKLDFEIACLRVIRIGCLDLGTGLLVA